VFPHMLYRSALRNSARQSTRSATSYIVAVARRSKTSVIINLFPPSACHPLPCIRNLFISFFQRYHMFDVRKASGTFSVFHDFQGASSCLAYCLAWLAPVKDAVRLFRKISVRSQNHATAQHQTVSANRSETRRLLASSANQSSCRATSVSRGSGRYILPDETQSDSSVRTRETRCGLLCETHHN